MRNTIHHYSRHPNLFNLVWQSKNLAGEVEFRLSASHELCSCIADWGNSLKNLMRDELSDFMRVERGDLTDAGVTAEVVLIAFSARYRRGSLSVIDVYLQGEGER